MIDVYDIINDGDLDKFELSDIKHKYLLEYVKYPSGNDHESFIQLLDIEIDLFLVKRRSKYILVIIDRSEADSLSFAWKGSSEDFIFFKTKNDTNRHLDWRVELALLIDILEDQTPKIKDYGLR